jgi:F-type H+-transporting ATPase subunit delta
VREAGGRIAKRYARALFELAQPDRLAEAQGWLRGFSVIWDSNKELQAVLTDPAIPLAKRSEIILAVANTIAPGQAVFSNFVALLLNNRRLPMAHGIAEAYEELVNEFKKILALEITSAFPLSEAEQSLIQEDIRRRLPQGYASMLKVEWKVDRDLIGGLLIRAGDRLLDGSLGGLLNRIEERMMV